jgi:hypothetical protein
MKIYDRDTAREQGRIERNIVGAVTSAIAVG